MKPVFLLKMTHSDQLSTIIRVHKQGHGRMYFRGDATWQWGAPWNPDTDPAQDHIIRDHSGPVRINWACWLHDGLLGLHTCILYTGDEFCIHEEHEDYEFVSALFDLGQLLDREVFDLNNAWVPGTARSENTEDQ